MEQYIDDV